MPQYILLLHEEKGTFQKLSPEEMQATIQKYKAWSARLAEAGHLRGGEKLADATGRVIRKGGSNVLDGPYAESKEVIGGFFMLDAANYEEATKLAADCPHVQFGTVEIREIEKV